MRPSPTIYIYIHISSKGIIKRFFGNSRNLETFETDVSENLEQLEFEKF
jgi:hypothetical protein